MCCIGPPFGKTLELCVEVTIHQPWRLLQRTVLFVLDEVPEVDSRQLFDTSFTVFHVSSRQPVSSLLFCCVTKNDRSECCPIQWYKLNFKISRPWTLTNHNASIMPLTLLQKLSNVWEKNAHFLKHVIFEAKALKALKSSTNDSRSDRVILICTVSPYNFCS